MRGAWIESKLGCWITVEKPLDALTSGSSDSPANADVIRPNKTITRNMPAIIFGS